MQDAPSDAVTQLLEAWRAGDDHALDEVMPLARVVELRYFGGFDHDEIAELLGVSNPTVRRRWRLAKAWLFRRLSASGEAPTDGG